MPPRYICIAFAVAITTWLPPAVVGLMIKPNVPSKVGKLQVLPKSNDESEKKFWRLSSASLVTPAFQPARGGPATAASAALVRLYKGYAELCEKKPLLTKSVTAAFINAIGDVLSQVVQAYITKSVLHIEWNRLGAFFLCGLVYAGPFVHLWYEQLWKLGRWMDRKYGSSKNTQTLAQVVMDQTVGVAIFFPSYFYVYEYLEALVSWRGKHVINVAVVCLWRMWKQA